MLLLERLNNDLKQAMRDKDKEKLSVIRMMKASIQYESLKTGKPLSEDEEIIILSRELKQRKDSLQEFEKAGRTDLIDKVKSEIAIVESYRPKQLTEEELLAIVKETIAEVGASSKKEMGKVMAAIMPKVKGKAEGAIINQLVSRNLE